MLKEAQKTEQKEKLNIMNKTNQANFGLNNKESIPKFAKTIHFDEPANRKKVTFDLEIEEQNEND